MTKTQLNAFRSALRNKQTELGNEGNREALAIETSPEQLDQIQHAGNRDWAMRNLERSSSQLHEVRDALRRLDSGSFGICMDCNEEIVAKRLGALPWASLCVVCQESADREKAPWNEFEISPVMAA